MPRPSDDFVHVVYVCVCVCELCTRGATHTPTNTMVVVVVVVVVVVGLFFPGAERQVPEVVLGATEARQDLCGAVQGRQRGLLGKQLTNGVPLLQVPRLK